MNPPRRLREAFGICSLREGLVNFHKGFVEAPWRLHEAFSKTRSAKASRSPLEGFVKGGLAQLPVKRKLVPTLTPLEILAYKTPLS